MVKKAACYCRVSTKKEEQLQSLEMQKQYFTEYCRSNNGYELYGIYADEGISGKSLKNRKAFDRMIRDARDGCFNVILVKDFSRFARNTVDLLTTVRMLKDMGVEVYFVNYNMTNLGDSELVITMMGALAQEESAALSKKLKLSKNMTAEKGRVPNFVFGYDRIDKFTLVPNEHEAGWVRRIFDMYVNEGIGTARIAEYLNNNGVMTKKKIAKGWTQHVISCMLRNELYVGKVINKKSEIADFKTGRRKEYDRDDWIIVDKPELRIVDAELFETGQKLLASRKDSFHLDGKRPSSKYPLSNLIACANDGYSFRRCSRRYSETGRLYKWWTCSHRNVKGTSACGNAVRIDEDQMHAAIAEFLLHIGGGGSDMAKRAGDYAAKEFHALYGRSCDRKKLLAERKLLESKKSRLVDLYADGGIGKNYLSDKLRPLTGRIAEINTALQLCQNFLSPAVDFGKSAAAFMDGAGARMEELLGNTFLKTIFDRFLVHGDGSVTAVLKNDCAGSSLSLPFGEITPDDAV